MCLFYDGHKNTGSPKAVFGEAGNQSYHHLENKEPNLIIKLLVRLSFNCLLSIRPSGWVRIVQMVTQQHLTFAYPEGGKSERFRVP